MIWVLKISIINLREDFPTPKTRTRPKWKDFVQRAVGSWWQLINSLACLSCLWCRKKKDKTCPRWWQKAKDHDSSIENMVSWQIQLIRIKCKSYEYFMSEWKRASKICVSKKCWKSFLWLAAIRWKKSNLWQFKPGKVVKQFWLGLQFNSLGPVHILRKHFRSTKINLNFPIFHKN